MSIKQGLPIIAFATAAAWEGWLAAHHGEAKGLWLKFAKQGSGIATLSYSDALDIALCHGWIDGQKNAFDDRFWLQKFTPRGARSKWSKLNCARVQALIKGKRMKPAGLAAVKAAKADGRWDAAYASPRNATVPPDLQAALDADPQAAAFFASLDGANRYAILYRLHDAKKPETRARRLARFLDMLARGEKIHP